MDPLIGYVDTTVATGDTTANASDGSNLQTGGIQQIDYSTASSSPNTTYSSPDVPYPVTPGSYNGSGSGSGGSQDTISQIFIYNDPRAALEALSALGL
jgi:hypothetical protein